MLFFMLILWGLAEWGGRGKPEGRPVAREFRHYLIAAGLVAALLPASVFMALLVVLVWITAIVHWPESKYLHK
jgi:hypothetical protein